MVDTIKFSQMSSGGDLSNDDKVPGILNGGNVLFNNPWTFLPPGTTAQRPAPSLEIQYRLRFNTDEQVYEYYDAITLSWVQLSNSGSINPGLAKSIAYYETSGTIISPLDIENNRVLVTDINGLPQLKTELPPNISIPNAIITQSTAELLSGQVQATPVNPDDLANKAYVDTAAGGGVNSIIGTALQVIASSPTGNVTLSLPQDIDPTSSPSFNEVSGGNINLSTNKISSLNASGPIALIPNGNGSVLVGEETQALGGLNAPFQVISANMSVKNAQMSILGYGTLSANGPSVTLTRSRSTSVDSFVSVIPSDRISNLSSYADDGSAFVLCSNIRTICTGAVSTGIIPSSLFFSTMNSIGVLTDALIINNSQNVTFPAGSLDIGSSSGQPSSTVTIYTPASNSGSLAVTAANNAGNHANVLTNASTSSARTWTLPDLSGTIQVSGAPTLITAPANSQSSSITLGAAFQNILGYDAVFTVYIAVSAATTADILLGVGSTNAPAQQTIVTGLTLAALNIIPITIYLPNNYYALLSTSGTITATISGQMAMPV